MPRKPASVRSLVKLTGSQNVLGKNIKRRRISSKNDREQKEQREGERGKRKGKGRGEEREEVRKGVEEKEEE